jgi:hypothetical protein
MTDQLERDLAEVFGSTAGDADVPPLPLEDVVARGRALQAVRRRRAALWTAVAAAVAVVAVCLPIAVAAHGGDQHPAPAHRTSVPPSVDASGRPTLAYLDHGTLHAAGLTVRTGGNEILSRGGTTYVATSKENPWSWSHLVDGRLKPASRTTASTDKPWLGWHGQALSPDGALLVVVTYPTQDTTRLIAYDTADDREIAHVDVAEPFTNWTGGGNSLTLLGIDATGRVFWVQEHIGGGKGPQTDWVWRPGHGEPSQLGEPFASQLYGMFAVTPAGPLVGNAVLGEGTNGGWQAVAQLSAGSAKGAVWSPSGAVYARRAAPPAFVTTASGTTVEARLPGALQRWIGFESETDVLGVVDTGQSAGLVRCDVTTGACPTIEKLPDSWKSWQWATNGPATSPAAPAGDSTPDVSSSPPSVPYVRDGVLHLDGRSIGTGLDRAVASGGTTLVMRLTEAGPKTNGANTTFVSLVAGDRLVPIPALTSVGLSNHESSYAPYLSADGRVAVAMSWHDGTTMRMTAWSVPERRVLGTVDLRDTMIAPEDIAGIERDGTVIYFDPDAQHGYAWLPGRAPHPLDASTSAAIERGAVMVGKTDLQIIHGISGDLLGGLSPDGSTALIVDADGTTSVRNLRTGHAVTLELPQHIYDPIGFETADAVLVTVGDEDGGPLMRCDTTSGACVQVWSDTSGIAFPRLYGGW